jgi:hypothetical protein
MDAAPADKARREVNKRRRHFNMSKTGFVSQMGNDATKTNPRDVLVDESKQADIENLGDCLCALGDGQSLGDFSLTIVLYGRSGTELDQLVAEFTGVFTNADGNLFAETYNQLNAYFATVPGNYTTLLTQNNEEVKVVQELLRPANSHITLDLYAQAGMSNKRLAQSKQRQHLAIGNGQFLQRLLHELPIRTLQQDALWRFLDRGERCLFAFKIERHGRGSLQSGAGGQERIPQNLINPGAKVCPRMKRREPLQGLGICFLHQVFGFMPVMRQPEAKL